MFGEKIKEIRKNNNLTQQEFADIFNTTRTTVANWENNICRPDPNQIIEMAKKFNVSTDYILNVDIDTFITIKRLMKQLGMMVSDDTTPEEFKKALQIIEVLKSKEE